MMYGVLERHPFFSLIIVKKSVLHKFDALLC